ncbi:MAG TPA: 50S ribosomal protein L11 methyltransferase [Candidatus Binatia bacterium]|nr:50S ribosomal protein L11 methyltransferase [Candidatus Binatia bacterium]
MPASWLQLSVRTDPAAMDAVSNFLIERGSPGVVIRKNEIQAYFVHSVDDALIRDDIQRFLGGLNGIYSHEPRLRWRLLKDKNWNSSWRRFFNPQKVGKAFWVTPPWATRPPIGRRHVITIDPGMAFGTGTHATTRGCMEFIERAAAMFRGTEFSALDVGTGSGILAIALAKLGARDIWAVDADPVALKAARENLHRNDVQEKIHLSRVKLSQIRRSFSLVVANLTAETIIDLAGTLEKRVAPKGFLILSGILYPKAQRVIHSFAEGFKVIIRKREKEWLTLLLRRR